VQDKKAILLSQIGLLRINLFIEFDKRISILEQGGQLDEAVEMMSDYALNIAIPFIPRKKSFVDKSFCRPNRRRETA